MADYYAILKRSISGLAEPTGESRRTVYEKARTALVTQLKSFDPPLSASEITQQRLQLEDAIRKVESESAKGLLSQALSRASVPERAQPREPLSPQPQHPAMPLSPPVSGNPSESLTEATGRGSTSTRFPTPPEERSGTPAPRAPFLRSPSPTPPTGPQAGMRLTKPAFEPIVRSSEQDGATDQPAAGADPQSAAPRPSAMPPLPIGRDRGTVGAGQRRTESEQQANFEQEDVTQPVANRVLKKAVSDIDRLGTASHESARRARDALAAAEGPLEEDLSTGQQSAKRSSRPTAADRQRSSADDSAPASGLNPAVQAAKRGSRWPLVIGLLVAATVVGLGAAALYMKREVIATYLGTQRPLQEAIQRAPSEKPVVKSTDRLLPDDTATKTSPTSNVKVVTTQPITTGSDTTAAGNTGGRTDVASATSPAPAPTPTATPSPAAVEPSTPPPALPSGEIPPIAQKASLLEEAADGTSAPVQTVGKVIWQLVKTPSPTPDKPETVRVQGRVEIPGRGMVMNVTMEQNSDAGLQASHIIKLDFKLPPDFDNKSISRVPGMIMKLAEQVRGDPLACATAKITSNLFWIALYSSDPDKAKNQQLIKDRGWIDIPIVYESNKRAMLTLEKAGAGDRVFNDAIAAWGG